MNEITLARFHDILYKFFAVLTCFGLFILSFDLITLLNHRNLHMFRYELNGWTNIIGIMPDAILIIGCLYMSNKHKKLSMGAKWRIP